MKAKLFQNKISVRPSKIDNYGVFADKNIRKGELIEECHAISDTTAPGPFLENYSFSSPHFAGRLFPLGFGMIYNHSKHPNAQFKFHLPTIMRFTATRFIPKGEEIRVFYSGNWFQNRGIEEKDTPLKFSWINNEITMQLSRAAIVIAASYGLFIFLMHNFGNWTQLLSPLRI
jgi:SET domain-containing protein